MSAIGHKTEPDQLLLPALRGRMGDWVYYTALMKVDQVVQRVALAPDVHQSKGLSDMIQRALTTNAHRIAEYLVGQPQRMMGSLVIGVYGGEPRWFAIDVKENIHNEPTHLDDAEVALGLLQLVS